MRNILVGIAIVGLLLAGAVPIAQAKARTAERGPGGGGQAEPDVAFLTPNDNGDLHGSNDTGVQGSGQIRDAVPNRPAKIDPVTGLSIRQRLQLLRDQGVSETLVRLMLVMFLR